MGRTNISEMGNDFASIACKCSDISPFLAKLILYHTLDDGYGKYFYHIFSEEDRQNPYLVRDIGALQPRQLNVVSKQCTDLAKKYVVERELPVGEWRQTWKDKATCREISKRLITYRQGELGDKFLRECSIRGSSIDLLVAKRALMDFVACSGCEEKIFSISERESLLYAAITNSDIWRKCGICQTSFLEEVSNKAQQFAGTELGVNIAGIPFVGVTFGWPAKNRDEWHLYGDLMSANILRGDLHELPKVFGAISYSTPAKMLRPFYESTWLCVVAVGTAKRVVPDSIGNTYMYNFPMRDIVSCKWVGKLSDIIGSYNEVETMINSEYKKVQKELDSNA